MTPVVLETQKRNIPWRWVFLLGMAGVPYLMMFMVVSGEWGSVAVVARMRIENPTLIGPLLSLDFVMSLLVGTTCLYLSDRIWTRFGRRKPVFLTAWGFLVMILLVIPFVENAAGFIVMMLLMFVCLDGSTAVDMLVFETVPPHQRGRYEAVKSIYLHLLIIAFNVAIGGRLLEVLELPGIGTISGVVGIFWLGALCLAIGIGSVSLYTRENPPEVASRAAPEEDGGGLTTRLLRPVRAIFASRFLWPVYLLACCLTLIQLSLGPFAPLLITEQWGYTLQDVSTNVIIGCLINICILPVIGILADKFNRVAMFAAGVVFYLAMVAAYYVFVSFVLPDARPMVWMMVAFGTAQSIAMLFVNTNFLPMCYDYIPRDMMGTALAGINLVRYFSKFLLMAPMGLFIKLYSGDGPNNYFSGYLYILFFGGVGLIILISFIRKVRAGELRPLGREGYETIEGGSTP